MTLAEFSLREYAYKRQEQWDWAKFRLVGFMAIRSFNMDVKNIPKKLSDVMELPFVDVVNNVGLSEMQIKAFKDAQEVYEQQVKLKTIE